MSEGFPYADIIILALIAGFILLRLRSVLGQKTGHENPDFFRPKPSDPAKPDAIIQLVEKIEKSIKPRNNNDKSAEAPNNDNDLYAKSLEETPLAQDINALKLADPLFNATIFLDGAKMAFEMVFDAFVKGDKQTLSMLLSQDIYNHFVQDIDGREKQENIMETTLLAVTPKEIRSIKLSNNVAQINVCFESEQVTIERGKNGEIVSGDPSDVHHVLDEWTFEREITSKNPNWKIIET
jgi:predicted lipid-binding transport protein (Tim44 family)